MTESGKSQVEGAEKLRAAEAERLVILERMKEIRELNIHENQLISDRFNWMLVVEGLLINAFIAAFNAYLDTYSYLAGRYLVLLGLSALGMLITLSFGSSFHVARDALRKLKIRYRELVKRLHEQKPWLCPITIGLYADHKDLEHMHKDSYLKDNKLDPWIALPVVFFIVWAVAFLCVVGLLVKNLACTCT